MAINTKKVLKDQFSGYKGTGNFKMSKQEKKKKPVFDWKCWKTLLNEPMHSNSHYNRDYGWFLPNKD